MNQKGFFQLILIIVLGAVLIIGGGSFWFYQQSAKQDKSASETQVIPESSYSETSPVSTEQPNHQTPTIPAPTSIQPPPPKAAPTAEETIILSAPKIVPTTQATPAQSTTSYWVQDRYGWKAVGTPPQCPEPLKLSSFVDLSKATSVLYPGQMRSVGYEPTAGFRFDGLPNEAIQVAVPLSGEVARTPKFA